MHCKITERKEAPETYSWACLLKAKISKTCAWKWKRTFTQKFLKFRWEWKWWDSNFVSNERKISEINGWSWLKGSPKFPTEISEWKMCIPFSVLRQFQPPSWNSNQVELVLGSLGKLGVVKLNREMENPNGTYFANYRRLSFKQKSRNHRNRDK